MKYVRKPNSEPQQKKQDFGNSEPGTGGLKRRRRKNDSVRSKPFVLLGFTGNSEPLVL
jgi:hypothetical protein